MRQFKLILTIVFCLFSVVAHADEIRDFYAEPGLNPFKDPLQNRSEAIDPFSGMLRLQVTDLFVPGNGGLDISVSRSYVNPQFAVGWYDGVTGIGWTMNYGRITVPAAYVGGVCDQTALNENTSNNPSIEHQDGSRELLVLATDGTTDLVTKSNWRARCLAGGNGFQVMSPDGTTYIMDAVASSGDEVSWFVSKITDIHGNSLGITYQQKNGLLYTSQVTGYKPDSGGGAAPDGRVVTFSYYDDPAGCLRLQSARSNNTTVNYTLEQAPEFMADSCKYQMTQVDYPDGSSWKYQYLGVAQQAGSHSLVSMTNPYGGQIDYTYQMVAFDPNDQFTLTSVVNSKTISGVGIPQSSAWSYSFAPHSVPLTDTTGTVTGYADQTTVTDPYGNKTVYDHEGYATEGFQKGWSVGLLLGKYIYDNQDNEIEVDTYTWDKRLVSTEDYFHGRSFVSIDTETYAPLLKQVSMWRSGATFDTIYSDFDQYGNPGTKEETTPLTGESSRITHYTYWSNADKYLLDKVQSEAIDGIGSTTRTFDTNTGDVLTENKYGVTTSFTYTPEGDLATVTDANNNQTRFSDYYRGIRRYEEYPEGKVISRTVNDSGTIASVVDGRHFTTQYSYDLYNRLTGITAPIHNPVSISWQPAAGVNAKRIVTRGGLKQTVTYDGFGRILSREYKDTATSQTVTKTYAYDAYGHMTYESDPNASYGVGTHYEYDAFGRQTKIIHEDNSTKTTAYGSGGAYLIVTDERGNQSNYLYRIYGSPDNPPVLKQSLNAENVCTIAQYNAIGLMTSLFQGSYDGSTTCNGYFRYYSYNSRYQLTSENNPENGTTQYGRDTVGNMTSKKVGMGGTTTYQHDGLNRLTFVNYSDATPDVTYSYDNNDNVLAVDNGISTDSFSYDANGNLEHKILTIDGKTLTVSYTYDANDVQDSVTYPSGRTVNYYPDSFGRPTQAYPYVTQVTYHPSGQLATIAYANGVTTEMDLQNRLWVSRIHTYGSSSLVDLNYSYDTRGNITAINDAVNTSRNRVMTYDAADRLTEADGPWGASTYGYDTNGNISYRNQNGTLYAYTYTGILLTNYASMPVSYDMYGNISQIGSDSVGRQFVFNESGTMASASRNYTSYDNYSYDGNGDRIKKHSMGSTTDTYYLHQSTGFVLGEYLSDPIYGKEYFYLGKQLIAMAKTNEPPIANAGSDQSVSGDSAVTLTGTASSDLDGSILGYQWTQTAGTPVTLSGASTATPGFTAPILSSQQTLTFALTVTDNDGESSTDSVNITVSSNTAPIANAGTDQSVIGGTTVSLDGSASSDAEGPIVSYSWQQTSGPLVIINNGTTANADFKAPNIYTATVLTFDLTVTDSAGSTSTDSVAITANPPPVLPQTTATVSKTKSKGKTYFIVTLTTNDPLITDTHYIVSPNGQITDVTPNPLTVTILWADTSREVAISYYSIDPYGYVEPTNNLILQ